MNWLNIALGIIILIVCIIAVIFSEGLLLPILLPIAFWGLQKLGIKT